MAIAVACSLSSLTISANEAINYPVQPNVGVRAGESDATESFADLLIPLQGTDESILFVNPRFSLLEEEVKAGSIGLGYRHIVSDKGIVGANLFIDSQQSQTGRSYKKYGVGLEWLGEQVDARFNWYDASDKAQVINEFQTQTRDVQRSTRTVARRSQIEVATNPIGEVETQELSRGEVTPIENRIEQNVTILATQEAVVTESRVTTTTKETARKQIDTTQIFEQFEAAKDGWDAEIGMKLPLSGAPETRVFVGHFHYDEPFKASDTSGTKGRIEMRLQNRLALDAQFYDQKINDTSYFVGLRYALPLSQKTGRAIQSQETPQVAQELSALQARMASEMVMRNWRVDTNISDPIEDIERRIVNIKTDKRRFTERARQILSQQETQLSEQFTIQDILYDRITWVDSDSTVPSDGTYESPFTSVAEAADNAGENNTIFVCGASTGTVCDLQGGGEYDENAASQGITLSSGQILTSSLLLSNGDTFETTTLTTLTNTNANASSVIFSEGTENLTINRVDIQERGDNFGSYGIRLRDVTNVSITNNTISSAGEESDAVNIGDSEGAIVVANNDIEVQSDRNTEGVIIENVHQLDSSVLIDGNTINASGVAASGILTSEIAAEAIIQNNIVNVAGPTDTLRGWGLRDFRSQNMIIRNNTFATTERSRALQFQDFGDSAVTNASAAPQVTIDNNVLSTGASSSGFNNSEVIFMNTTEDNATLTITNNDISSVQDNAHGIRNRRPGTNVTVNNTGNTFNLTGASAQEYLLQP